MRVATAGGRSDAPAARGVRARVGRGLGSLARFALVTLVLLVASASPAAADPAGPTDDRTEILDMGAAAGKIEARMIGGDSFLEFTVEPGVEVIVVGYRGEPMVAFRPDGTVEENSLSPSVVLNEDRYGEAELPASVDAEAPPVWEPVGSGGRWAWHDHRTHWMNQARPPGRQPGDTILEAVVPLSVDGVETGISVRSVWQPGPSPVPAAVGALVGVALVGAAWRWRTTPVVLALSLAAAGLGWWATQSVPPETGPPIIAWLAPSVAVVAAAAALVGGRSGRLDPLIGDGLAGLAAIQLGLWAWFQREAVVRAIIPTEAPPGLHRAVVVAAGVCCIGVLGLVVARNLRVSSSRPVPS